VHPGGAAEARLGSTQWPTSGPRMVATALLFGGVRGLGSSAGAYTAFNVT
jgi:hypothetical protein